MSTQELIEQHERDRTFYAAAAERLNAPALRQVARENAQFHQERAERLRRQSKGRI